MDIKSVNWLSNGKWALPQTPKNCQIFYILDTCFCIPILEWTVLGLRTFDTILSWYLFWLYITPVITVSTPFGGFSIHLLSKQIVLLMIWTLWLKCVVLTYISYIYFTYLFICFMLYLFLSTDIINFIFSCCWYCICLFVFQFITLQLFWSFYAFYFFAGYQYFAVYVATVY